MNLHVARWTAEQKAGSILSDVTVGGQRLCISWPNAKAHFWDEGTGEAAMMGNVGALGFINVEDILVGLTRPEERRRQDYY